MSGAHPRAAWLDAMGVDRWVVRGATDESDGQTTGGVAVQWLSCPDSPRLTVLTCSPLGPASHVVLDRMLAAIQVVKSDCAVGETDLPGAVSSMAATPVLVLAQDGEEPAWQAEFAHHTARVEVIAHPDRFAADPSLKRPAWEALKRLEHTLNGG